MLMEHALSSMNPKQTKLTHKKLTNPPNDHSPDKILSGTLRLCCNHYSFINCHCDSFQALKQQGFQEFSITVIESILIYCFLPNRKLHFKKSFYFTVKYFDFHSFEHLKNKSYKNYLLSLVFNIASF